MGKDHRIRKTPEQDKTLADALTEGIPIGQALLKAGYTKRQSLKGMAAVPERVLKILPKKAQRLMNLAKMTAPEQQRDLVIGRLVDNVTKGSDKAVQSAKALGGTRDNNLFTPDLQMGVIVLTCPQSAIDNKARLLSVDDEER
jgi:hypothetical protein